MCAREAHGTTRKTLCDIELFICHIRDGKVRDVDLVGAPGRLRVGHTRRKREAKNRQLETETPTVLVIEIARDIPPLVAESRVRPVILGEREPARCFRPGETGVGIVTQKFRESRCRLDKFVGEAAAGRQNGDEHGDETYQCSGHAIPPASRWRARYVLRDTPGKAPRAAPHRSRTLPTR